MLPVVLLTDLGTAERREEGGRGSREREEGGRRIQRAAGAGIADTENLRQYFSNFSELMQALSKIVPPLEQLVCIKMLLKVRLHRAISD